MFKGHGCWLSYLIIDGKEYWRLEDDIPAWKGVGELTGGIQVLPSDSSKRLDCLHMHNEEWEKAEDEKYAMEQLQRKDKAMRITSEKARKKMNA